MNIKILKTEQAYNEACEKIYRLINSTEKPIETNSPEGEELELLSLLVEKYEQEHYPINAPNPIEAIKFRMDQMNLKQADIASLFGGKTRISEVLHGKRALTLNTITLLNRYLGVPLESMVIGSKSTKIDPEISERLLSILSIREYFTKNNKTALI